MPLPKQGEKKYCNNCDNDIAENRGKKVVMKSGESKKKSVTFTIFSQ